MPSLHSQKASQLIKKLDALSPLPKPHHTWRLTSPADQQPLLLAALARMTGSLGISAANTVPSPDFDQVLSTANAVPGTTIAINYSPWHYVFDPTAPPTDVGQTHDAELDLMDQRFGNLASAIGTAPPVGPILLDSERFLTTGDPTWDAAIENKHTLVYDIAKSHFPASPVYWYGRGGFGISASPTGWSESRLHTLGEPGDGFSCSLYHVPEIEVTREGMRKTVANAALYDVSTVVPWVGLAAGYRRQKDQFHLYDLNWDYDSIYSWLLGREINVAWWGLPDKAERFAPWHAAPAVIFYPDPFDPRTPQWFDHFIEYCAGANWTAP